MAAGSTAPDFEALQLLRAGKLEDARALAAQAVANATRCMPAHGLLATILLRLGRADEAEAACDRAIALDAGQYPSYLLRSELRVQTAAANHIDELQRQLSLRPDD